ncbi:uncharacterized protein LOC128724650 [Anopheles nili]|uniref:uncharacterized protein LOC128724650 n=1 Tax=Anopheles nili TaxID=185578 RepID=UPI00237BE416|nr:uncharacterized protein LOC128724650 [Anopheles nili]
MSSKQRKLSISGPSTRKPLQSIRRASLDEGVALIVFCVAIVFSKSTVPTISKSSASCESFLSLGKDYKNVDDNLWYTLDVCLHRSTDAHKPEPGTVLFLHNRPTAMVDEFITRITNITACNFGGTRPIILNGKYFHRADIQQDYGVFVQQQKTTLLEQGVMVVRNLEDIPAKAAQAFHTICDTEEPLVEKAIIYLSLDTSKTVSRMDFGERSATAEAEHLLQEMWKNDLRPEFLNPLIVRLTENVYRIG